MRGSVAEATAITQAHPEVHGGPVHIGSPAVLGIADLSKPDWDEPVRMEPNDVPTFWPPNTRPAWEPAWSTTSSPRYHNKP